MKQIETERLLLRGFRMEDAEDLFCYACRAEVGPSAGWTPHRTIEDSRDYLRSCIPNMDCWAIVLKETGHVIGSIGLHDTELGAKKLVRKELGFVLSPEHWHKGLMQEAAGAILAYAFTELAIDIVVVTHFIDNHASRNTIAALGFTYEGHLIAARSAHDGTPKDVLQYSMTREQWRQGASPKRRYAFMQNRSCEYFPCHPVQETKNFNCMFCYCPLYRIENCGGNYAILDNGVKDCTNCTVPHFSYDLILERLKG